MPLPTPDFVRGAARRRCSVRRSMLLTALGLSCWGLIAACGARSARAQDTAPSTTPSTTGTELFKPAPDGPGIQLRGGHYAFPTFGRDDSMTHVELFPYILDDNQMFFGDLRGFITNDQQFGGNLGFGYRTRPWGGTNIFGASLWYDVDDSPGALYQDVGLSLETYGDLFDFRINGYAPVGDTEKQIADRLTNPRFVGNGLIYDRVRVFGQALPGVDYEIGLPLPTDVLRQHNLRWYIGGYHFAAGGVDAINGVKTRLEGSIIPSLDAQVLLTSDQTFGTNVMLGINWTYFGKFERKETNRALRYDRMSEFVQRNYNVIVGKRREVTTGLSAINPATGLPFVIQHVGPGGNSSGAPDDPWGTIADAQAAGGDVIIVQAGTILTAPIVLQDGDIIIGQGGGAQTSLAVQGYGPVLLPNVGGGVGRPIIQGVAGDAVTLASNSLFAGFQIDSPTGNGIFGNGVHDVYIGDVAITGAGGGGILLENTTGNIAILGTDISDASGIAFHIDGGSATIQYTGDIENSTDRALVVENTAADGYVDFSGSSITDDGGDGVLLLDNDGDVLLQDVTVKNATGIGIEVRGGDGAASLLGTTTVTDATGTGIHIEDRGGNTFLAKSVVTAADGQNAIRIFDNTADVWLFDLDLKSKNATALDVADTNKLIVSSGVISSVGGAAVDLANTDMSVALKKVDVDGGAFGIRLVDADGTFVVSGGAGLGSGGTIKNTTTGIVLDDVKTVGLANMDLTSNGRGIDADDVDQLAITNFRITNSTSHAADLFNVHQFHVINSTLTGNGTAGIATINAVMNETGSYVFSISQSTIESNVGEAIHLDSLPGAAGASLNFALLNSAIVTHANFANAVTLDWNGVLLANIVGNGIQTTGSGSSGLDITASSTAALSQIGIGQNVFLMDGANSRALRIDTSGPSEILIGVNEITLNGASGFGMEFDLAESADVSIFTNSIVDMGGGGTGMRFNSMDGPSIVEIEDNLIDLRGPGALIDRGIIFQSITDVVTLKGTKNNQVRNATTPFFAPAGGTTGSIRINGQTFP